MHQQGQKCCIIWDVEGHNRAVRHNFPNVAQISDCSHEQDNDCILILRTCQEMNPKLVEFFWEMLICETKDELRKFEIFEASRQLMNTFVISDDTINSPTQSHF